MPNKVSKVVIALLVFTFIKGLFWVFITPIFQAPDEPQHYSYVQYLVETHRIPKVIELDFTPSERLKKQIELLEVEQIAHNAHIQHSFYRSAGDIAPNDLVNAEEVVSLDPTPGEFNYIHNYGPLYYLLNVPIYLAFEPILTNQIYGMRILSVLLSCITILLVYLTAKTLVRRLKLDLPHFPLLLGLLFTLHPQFSFISASVNNDNLIILWFTLFFYLAVKWCGENLNIRQILIFLLLGFFAFVTKTHGIILILMIVAYLFFDLIKRFNLKKSALFLCGIMVAIFAVAPVFYYQILNGFISSYAATSTYFQNHSFLWFLKTITFTRLFRTYKSFWGRYGWLDTLMPEWFYYILFLLMLLTVVGLILWIIKNYKDRFKMKLILFLGGSILLVDFVYTILFAKNAILFEYYNFPIQGRYYFIVLFPILFLMSLGLISLVKERFGKFVIYGAIYVLFFVHVISLFGIIPIRYYL